MPPVTICLINQKGGCGKSSTCFHLAGHFAHTGQRVLLIDADPQGSLSQGFFRFQLRGVSGTSGDSGGPVPDTVVSGPARPSGYARRCKASRSCAPTSIAAHNTPCPESAGLKTTRPANVA